MPDALEFICPACGRPLAPAPDHANLLQCPGCGKQFFKPTDAGESSADPGIEAPAHHSDALNTVRIRSYATARRAAYRARSYCIIAALTCGGILIQMIWTIIQQVRLHGWDLSAAGYLVFAILGAAGLLFFSRRARAFHREAKRPAREPGRGVETMQPNDSPAQPPDFSTLDNGSKWARNMDQIR